MWRGRTDEEFHLDMLCLKCLQIIKVEVSNRQWVFFFNEFGAQGSALG